MYVAAPTSIPGKGLGAIDVTQFGWEDWLLIGIIGMFVIGEMFPKVYEPRAPKPKRRRKPVSGSAGFAGGLVTAAILAGGGYLAYQYLLGGSASNG